MPGDSLWFTAVSLHSETKTRRVANLLTVIQNHRELWSDFYHSPQLSRVMEPSADIARQPVTREEERSVKLVIQHLNGVFQAMQNGLVIKPEGIRRDVWSFFESEGVKIPFIGLDALIKTKEALKRDQDKLDLKRRRALNERLRRGRDDRRQS